MRSVKRKSTETKDKTTSWQAHEWADRLTTRQGMREKKKRNGKSEKKRCGFIMFVNESAAAGCGIPNDCQKKNATLSKKASPESLVRESFS